MFQTIKTNNMAKYTIVETTEITADDSVIDFNKLMNRGPNYLRYNKDGSKALLKYDGDQPSFLNGKTTYTHEEIRTEMAESDWTEKL